MKQDIAITINPDHVKFEDQIYNRPFNISPSEWMKFWEASKGRPDLEEEIESLRAELDEVKGERDVAEAQLETSSGKAADE